FDEAKLPQSFDDVPRFERQLLGGLLQFVTGPLDLPFRPRPFPIGPLLAALPPGIIDHVPDAYLHALGTPIMACGGDLRRASVPPRSPAGTCPRSRGRCR